MSLRDDLSKLHRNDTIERSKIWEPIIKSCLSDNPSLTISFHSILPIMHEFKFLGTPLIGLHSTLNVSGTLVDIVWIDSENRYMVTTRHYTGEPKYYVDVNGKCELDSTKNLCDIDLDLMNSAISEIAYYSKTIALEDAGVIKRAFR